MAAAKTKMGDDEMLDLVCWLIDRYDNLRSAVANRAAMVVSGDAIFLAGVTFLLDSVLSAGVQFSQMTRIVLILSIGANLTLLALSIVYATNATVIVWKTSRATLSLRDLPQLLFFHPRDSANSFDSIERFEDKFKATTKKRMLHYALGELLLITKALHSRYEILRKAMRLLLISIAPFLIAVILLFSSFF